MNKEILSKMSVEQLESLLAEAKQEFRTAAANLNKARQDQLLKSKQVRGKTSKRKQALISQIQKINKETSKLNAKTKSTKTMANISFDTKARAANKKESQRRRELMETGTYQTSFSDEEKVLSWCYDMHVSYEQYLEIIEEYGIEELASMSGDDFYDEIVKGKNKVNKEFTQEQQIDFMKKQAEQKWLENEDLD